MRAWNSRVPRAGNPRWMISLDGPEAAARGPQDTGREGLQGAAAATGSRGPGERRPGERSPQSLRQKKIATRMGGKSRGSSTGKTRTLKRPHHRGGEGRRPRGRGWLVPRKLRATGSMEGLGWVSAGPAQRGGQCAGQTSVARDTANPTRPDPRAPRGAWEPRRSCRPDSPAATEPTSSSGEGSPRPPS